MKIRMLLILSVCLNLGLFGAFWMAQRPAEPATSQAERPVGDASQTTPPSKPGGKAPSPVVTEDFPFHWASVESEDFRQYIDNMRAIGMPEETIRDIVIAEINKIYAGKIRAVYPAPETYAFWEPREGGRGFRGGPGGLRGGLVPNSREIEDQVRALEREKQRIIEELLGVTMEAELDKWEGRPDEVDYRLGFLPPEKRAQVEAAQERFRESGRAIWENEALSGDERREQFVALRQQQEDELKSMLSPQEFEDYQLRTSRTATDMRRTLGSFNPSEQEFREIFRLRQQFEEQFAGREVDPAAREAAQTQLEQNLATVLGTERFEEYQLSQDNRYRDIHQFAQRNELPSETARAIYDIRNVVEQERRQVLADASLVEEERALILAAMAQETRQVLASTLGEELFSEYSERDGRWVNRVAETDGNLDRGRRRFGGRRGR